MTAFLARYLLVIPTAGAVYALLDHVAVTERFDIISQTLSALVG